MTIDFNALYQDSLRLTTSHENDIPTLERGLEQLDQAARSFHGGALTTSSHTPYQAHYLLAGRGFDASALETSLNTMELKTAYEPTGDLVETDIDAYLSHHHDMLVVTAIEEAKVATKKKCRKQSVSYLATCWKKDTKRLSAEMGMQMGKYQVANMESNQGQATLTSSKLRSQSSVVQPPMSTTTSTTSSHLNAQMQQYASVMHALNDSNGNSFDLLGKFKSIEETSHQGLPSDFFNCWNVLQNMIHVGTEFPQPIVQHQFKKEYGRNSQKVQVHLAMGSKTYLENQFKTYMSDTVKQAKRGIGGTPGLLPVITQFVSLPHISSGSSGPTFWAKLYYSLRCGGTEEALHLVQSALDGGASEPLLENLVNVLEPNNPMKPASMGALRSVVSSRDGSLNDYKTYVSNLLGGGDPNYSDPSIVKTIEDFIWQRLYFVCCEDNVVSYSIDTLSTTLLSFGASHFDADGKSPIVYLQVLLLCQQFERAVEYIAMHGLSVEAVHLSIALEYYGLLRRRLDTTEGSSSLLFPSSSLLSLNSTNLPTFHFVVLIKQYVNLFTRVDKPKAVHYLLCITPENERNRLLAHILLDTREFETYVGTMQPDASTTRGLLHTYLPQEVVTSIVLEAMSLAETANRFEDAVDLSYLAGALAKTISLFNRQLSLVVKPSVHHDRILWKQKATTFSKVVLSQPSVQTQLESVANRNAVQTFSNLVLFMDFMDLVQGGQYVNAMTLLDSTHLLPHPEYYPKSINDFLDFEESVKNVFHFILLGYMKCCSARFSLAKNQRDEYSMGMLQRMARMVVSYAGMIKFRLPPGTNEALNDMEVRMI